MKQIGIVGYFGTNDKGSITFGIPFSYYNFFSKFGNVQIIGHRETKVRELDLSVIPGGPDVDTSRYLEQDEEIDLMTGRPCLIRERFDRVLLPKYVENNTPIFGIN